MLSCVYKTNKESLYRSERPPIWRAPCLFYRIKSERVYITERHRIWRECSRLYTKPMQKCYAEALFLQSEGRFAFPIENNTDSVIRNRRASNLEGMLSFVYKASAEMRCGNEGPPIWRAPCLSYWKQYGEWCKKHKGFELGGHALVCIQSQSRLPTQKWGASNLKGALPFVLKTIQNLLFKQKGLESGGHALVCIQSQ